MESAMLTSKTCLNCGDNVGPGRKDKKYCSEACKTEYNNKLQEQKRDAKKPQQEPSLPTFIGDIQQILIKNREILDKCLGENDSRRVEKRDLEGRGFNFKYITSQAPTLADKAYCFCYELGYKEVENDRIVIVRREREVIC
jgi:predicted nucleic acid-binding Zn ribbon protein